MKMILLATALVLVGCSKKSDDAAGGGDPCGTAINAAVDKMIASRGADAPPAMTEIANKLRTLMTEHCRADKWAADNIACFAQASDQPSIKACRQKLPQEQAQKLQMAILKVMSAGARDNGGMRGGGMGGGHGGMGGGPPDMGGGSGGGSGGGAPVGNAEAGSAAPVAGSGSAAK